jgi:hypothetical protein
VAIVPPNKETLIKRKTLKSLIVSKGLLSKWFEPPVKPQDLYEGQKRRHHGVYSFFNAMHNLL